MNSRHGWGVLLAGAGLLLAAAQGRAKAPAAGPALTGLLAEAKTEALADVPAPALEGVELPVPPKAAAAAALVAAKRRNPDQAMYFCTGLPAGVGYASDLRSSRYTACRQCGSFYPGTRCQFVCKMQIRQVEIVIEQGVCPRE